MNMTHTHVELATVAAPIYAHILACNSTAVGDETMRKMALNEAEKLLTEAALRKCAQIAGKPFVAA